MDIIVHQLRSSTLVEKTNKTSDKNVVQAWIANVKTAATFPVVELNILQKRFGHLLTVTQLKGGGMAIYPSHPGEECDKFTAFMRDHTPFQSQKLDLRRST